MLHQIIEKNLLAKRGISLLIDMFLATLIGIGIEFILSTLNMTSLLNQKAPFFISFFLIIIRDTYNEFGSIGKSIMKIKIENIENRGFFIFRKILRNMTLPILILEIFIALLFKGRRIGDMIAYTKVS